MPNLSLHFRRKLSKVKFGWFLCRCSKLWKQPLILAVLCLVLLFGMSSYLGAIPDTSVDGQQQPRRIDAVNGQLHQGDVAVFQKLSRGGSIRQQKMDPLEREPFNGQGVSLGGECPLLTAPLPQREDHTFRPVSSSRNLYLYSAHIDAVSQTVTIVGISRVHPTRSEAKFCQFWRRPRLKNPATAKLHGVEAKLQPIKRGNHGIHEYMSVFITCQLPMGADAIPYAVSVVRKRCDKAETFLPLVDGRVSEHRYNFTVCVKPFNFNYKKIWQLLEFIELSKILGADRFVFYDQNTSSQVLETLEFYTTRDMAQVFPWKLPVRVRTWPPTPKHSQLHAFGQLASSNECLHRYRHLSRFIAFVDLDEFIVPTKDSLLTWHDLIEERLRHSPNTSAFLFKNLFIRKDWFSWAEDAKDLRKVFSEPMLKDIFKFKLDSLQHIRREKSANGYGQRSKFIVDPRKVSMVDIHSPSRYLTTVDKVPETYGLVYHYRDWEAPENPGPVLKSTLVPAKYGSKLLHRIQTVLQQLGLKPSDPGR